MVINSTGELWHSFYSCITDKMDMYLPTIMDTHCTVGHCHSVTAKTDTFLPGVWRGWEIYRYTTKVCAARKGMGFEPFWSKNRY